MPIDATLGTRSGVLFRCPPRCLDAGEETPSSPGPRHGRAGAYFVTVCAASRGPVFGRLVGDRVLLGRTGRIIAETSPIGWCPWTGSAWSPSGSSCRITSTPCCCWTVPGVIYRLIAGFKSATGARDVVRRCPGVAAPIWRRGCRGSRVAGEDDLARVLSTSPPTRCGPRCALRTAVEASIEQSSPQVWKIGRAGWNPALAKAVRRVVS